MKAEKRKELESNTLAKNIVRMSHRITEKPGQTTYIIGGIAVLVLVTIVAWFYFRGEREKSSSKRWTALAEATSDADLEKIAKENKDSPAGKQARLLQARSLMAKGQAGLFRPDLPKPETPRNSPLIPEPQQVGRSEAVKMLTDASKTFEELAPEYSDEPVIAQECYMNAASIQVSLENFDSGLKLYQELAKKYPKSDLGKEAEKRAQHLADNRGEIEEFVKNLPHPKPLPPLQGSGG